MLGIAIIGLFLRPGIKRLPDFNSAVFYIAILLLGFLLINGINWLGGLILALLFETELPETVSIVAPAILFINLGYYVVNRMLQRF